MAREADFSTERASKGGHARAAALTPEQRAETARRGAAARWAKARAGGTIAMSAEIAPKGETTRIEIAQAYQDGPLITTEVGTCSVNSRSYVIMPSNQGGSYTQ